MSETEWEVDIFDDDFWKGYAGTMQRRQRGFAAMRRIRDLSDELTRQADEEYQQRMAAESPQDRQRRDQRARTLKDLIVRAEAAEDPGEAERLWQQVDAIVRAES